MGCSLAHRSPQNCRCLSPSLPSLPPTSGNHLVNNLTTDTEPLQGKASKGSASIHCPPAAQQHLPLRCPTAAPRLSLPPAHERPHLPKAQCREHGILDRLHLAREKVDPGPAASAFILLKLTRVPRKARDRHAPLDEVVGDLAASLPVEEPRRLLEADEVVGRRLAQRREPLEQGLDLLDAMLSLLEREGGRRGQVDDVS
mmetsp:Transcript_26177/g.64645  ORF Transcript_26177/g.64645 Transcript_26177/m.64645 type:complete len:200 (-) Transcript_26177:937-1536(-)